MTGFSFKMLNFDFTGFSFELKRVLITEYLRSIKLYL